MLNVVVRLLAGGIIAGIGSGPRCPGELYALTGI